MERTEEEQGRQLLETLLQGVVSKSGFSACHQSSCSRLRANVLVSGQNPFTFQVIYHQSHQQQKLFQLFNDSAEQEYCLLLPFVERACFDINI